MIMARTLLLTSFALLTACSDAAPPCIAEPDGGLSFTQTCTNQCTDIVSSAEVGPGVLLDDADSSYQIATFYFGYQT